MTCPFSAMMPRIGTAPKIPRILAQQENQLFNMIHVIRSQATPEQMRQMLEALGIYIKLAVDVERGILAGGGELHADCELIVLENGSKQANVWGADWYPLTQTVG